VASPGTSRQASGEATPPTVLLELGPDPEQGARVWLVHGTEPQDGLARGSETRSPPLLDPSLFGPVPDGEPTVLPPEPDAEFAELAGRWGPSGGPMLPEEIISASGLPSERRPTPPMSALDWVRVFGPLGAEDRAEEESDGPSWAEAAAPGPPRPATSGETTSARELASLELLEVLAPVSARSLGTSHDGRVRAVSWRVRNVVLAALTFGVPMLAVLVLAAPAVGAPGAREQGVSSSSSGDHVGGQTPTGTTTALPGR
jgi:hypothetical protein